MAGGLEGVEDSVRSRPRLEAQHRDRDLGLIEQALHLLDDIGPGDARSARRPAAVAGLLGWRGENLAYPSRRPGVGTRLNRRRPGLGQGDRVAEALDGSAGEEANRSSTSGFALDLGAGTSVSLYCEIARRTVSPTVGPRSVPSFASLLRPLARCRGWPPA